MVVVKNDAENRQKKKENLGSSKSTATRHWKTLINKNKTEQRRRRQQRRLIGGGWASPSLCWTHHAQPVQWTTLPVCLASACTPPWVQCCGGGEQPLSPVHASHAVPTPVRRHSPAYAVCRGQLFTSCIFTSVCCCLSCLVSALALGWLVRQHLSAEQTPAVSCGPCAGPFPGPWKSHCTQSIHPNFLSCLKSVWLFASNYVYIVRNSGDKKLPTPAPTLRSTISTLQRHTD